ncbi:primase-like DNA-binding domain-containing protein [Eisenbergiella tayi]|uniref:primase-like DNA-binding domain-containing protein n=1 Tax=Eisenbergiella tayi TaxID=1432052 RepID=UPI000471C028|nr:primase-like DNA-binding domain-containing protein [Eisenbergiella tayi]
MKLIPFERHFSPQEQDTGLKALFQQQSNLSGIFNWLIEGYRLLKVEGLTVPERVLQATKEYRQETDIVGTFLNDTLMESEGNRVPTGALYRRFVEWIKDNGYRPLNSKNFVGELRSRYDIRRDGVRGNEVVDVDYIPRDAPWRDG